MFEVMQVVWNNGLSLFYRQARNIYYIQRVRIKVATIKVIPNLCILVTVISPLSYYKISVKVNQSINLIDYRWRNYKGVGAFTRDLGQGRMSYFGRSENVCSGQRAALTAKIFCQRPFRIR